MNLSEIARKLQISRMMTSKIHRRIYKEDKEYRKGVKVQGKATVLNEKSLSIFMEKRYVRRKVQVTDPV